MAYFTKRPYYGLFVKTHMLQPQAACEGGAEGRGQPLSPLRRTAPLTQGSRRQPLSLLQQPAPLTQGSRGQPLSLLRSQLPLHRGAEGNPSVCCGGQLPLHSSHRNSFSSYSGVAVGLFSEKSTPYSFLQNARPSAALRPAKGSRRRGQPLSLLRQPAPLTQGSRRKGNPSVRCGRQLPLYRGAKEGTTTQSAAADSSPYMLQPQAACEGGSRGRDNLSV